MNKRRLLATTLLLWASAVGLAFSLDLLDPVRAVDQLLTPDAPLPDSQAAPPLLLFAVDRRLVDNHGCPPYAPDVLKAVEAKLIGLGVRKLALPDGAAVWLRPGATPTAGLSYLVPRVLAWDTYSKRWTQIAPPEAPGLVAADATVVAGVNPTGRSIPIAPGEGTSFAWWLANRLRPGTREPQAGETVRFQGPASSLPVLPLSRILEGDLSRNDVRGSLGLLALTDARCRPLSAVAADPQGMSSAEVVAAAALTLLGAPLGMLSPFARIAYLAAIGLLSLLLLSRSSTRQRPLVAALLLALCVSLAYGLALLGMRPPLCAALALVVTLFGGLQLLDRLLTGRQLAESQRRLQRRFERLGTKFPHSTEVGPGSLSPAFLQLVSPFLPVQVSALLTRVGPHQLQLTLSNVAEERIDERRRDLRRTPWRDVLQSPSGLPLQGFFADPSLSAYGLPLWVGPEAVGALVLGLSQPVKLSDRQCALLERLTGALAATLGRVAERGPDRLDTLLGKNALESAQRANQRVSEQILAELERSLVILDRMPAGVVLFDLLGEVNHCNTFAREAFERLAIPFPAHLLALIAQITGQRPATALEFVQAAVLGEEVIAFECRTPACAPLRFRLSGLSNAGAAEPRHLLLTVQEGNVPAQDFGEVTQEVSQIHRPSNPGRTSADRDL